MIGGVTAAPAEQAAARRNERELDRFQGGWSRKRRLTSRRSGSCASATGWAYNQPKADRFFYRHKQCARKVIDKTMIRNDLLIFASVSEHLGKNRPKLRL